MSSYEQRKKSSRKKDRKRRRRRYDDDSDEPRRKKSHKKRRKRERGAGDTQDHASNGLNSSVNVGVEAAEKVKTCASAETSTALLPNVDTSETKEVKKPAASKGPMTQAQYQELYSQIHEVIDPHTGRTRWQRGTGEIVERIVSREEHLSLNACATRGDGASFGRDIVRAAARK